MPNLRDRPVPGDKYRHFKKGHIYEVVVMAISTQTGGIMVIYKNQDGQHFARPLIDFMGKVLWDGIRRWRFEKVTAIERLKEMVNNREISLTPDDRMKNLLEMADIPIKVPHDDSMASIASGICKECGRYGDGHYDNCSHKRLNKEDEK